jgi:predicted PurR-regulated permease PerM
MALWILAVVAVMLFLRMASQLLIPIVIAILVSYALEPVVAWLAERRVPRMAGATLVLAVVLGVCGWGAYSLRDEAVEAVASLPDVAQRLRDVVWSEQSSDAVAQVRQAARALDGTSGAQAEGTTGTIQAAGGVGQMGEWVQQAVGSVLALAGNLTVIVFLVFFLLVAGGHFRERIVEVAGRRLEQRRITAKIIDDINTQIQRFLLVRLVTAAAVALATWLVLAWMGMAQAAVWGVLAGVFNSIPYFGPIIVSGGLLLVGLVV